MLSAEYKFDAAKRLFFDAPAVESVFTKKERRVLSRSGRFVQRKARGFIRKRKKPSKPGKSPTNQTDRYKKSILFFADLNRRSVIIGPTKLNQDTPAGDGSPVGSEVPAVLEAGGEIQILEQQIFPGSDQYRRAAGRRTNDPTRDTRLRTVTIEPRPHISTAFEAEQHKFADLFRGN